VLIFWDPERSPSSLCLRYDPICDFWGCRS